jgi:hypothetical protein
LVRVVPSVSLLVQVGRDVAFPDLTVETTQLIDGISVSWNEDDDAISDLRQESIAGRQLEFFADRRWHRDLILATDFHRDVRYGSSDTAAIASLMRARRLRDDSPRRNAMAKKSELRMPLQISAAASGYPYRFGLAAGERL